MRNQVYDCVNLLLEYPLGIRTRAQHKENTRKTQHCPGIGPMRIEKVYLSNTKNAVAGLFVATGKCVYMVHIGVDVICEQRPMHALNHPPLPLGTCRCFVPEPMLPVTGRRRLARWR